MSSSSTKLSEILQAIDQVLQSAENQSPVDFMAKLPEYNRVLHLVREYLQRSPLPPPVKSLPPKVPQRVARQLPPPPPPAKGKAKTGKKLTVSVPVPPPPMGKKLPPPLPPVSDTTTDLVKKRQELLQEIEKLEKQRHEKWAIAQQYSQQQKVIQEFCQALLPVVQENLNNYFSLWQSYGQSNVSLLNQFIGTQATEELYQSDHQQIHTNRPNFPPSNYSTSQTKQDFLDSTLLLNSQINTPLNFSPLAEEQPTKSATGDILPYPGYEYPHEDLIALSSPTENYLENYIDKYDKNPETVLVSLPNVEQAIAPDFASLDNSSTNLNQIDTDDFDVSSMGDLAPSIDTHPYKLASPDENLLPNADLIQLVPNLELFLDIEIIEKLQKELDLLESFNDLDDDEDVTIIQNDTTWLNTTTVEEQNIFTAPDHAHLHRINPFDTDDFEQDLPDLVGLLRQMPTTDQSDNTTGESEQINMKTTLSDLIASFHSEYTNLQDSSLDNSLDNLQLGDLADLMTENSKWFQAGHQISEGKPSQEKLSSSPPPVQSLNQPVSPPQTSNQGKKNSINSPLSADWYLGIDFGSTGMAASLLHKASGEIYPLTWQAIATPIVDPSENPTSLEENIYAMHRLPCQVYWQANTDSPRTKLENFKTCLQITLPYTQVDVKRQKITTAESFVATISLEATTNQEPMLQWSPHEAISLETIRKSLIVLLGNLRPVNVPLRPNLLENQESLSLPNYYLCNADGLDANTLNTALQELKGVILGCPAGWSEAYRYNLREAVLSAGLVQNINQVMIIEDAIATALSILTVNQKTGKSWRAGRTLIINLGASTSQIALVNLPEEPEKINYNDFICRSFAYGGYALDQDIICQLLLPSNHQQSFPQVAHPDLGIRYQLQQWLNNSPVRQSLWETAEKLKMILPTEENFTLQLADQVWQIDRQNLEKSVLIPYLQQLNSQLNNFLAQIGVSAVAINQAICTGGGSQWGAIARWLRQKLPNAVLTIDQETNILQRVAHGLACLPLYPQLASNPKKPYSDYFILWEILRAFPEQPVNIQEIYQILEKRGINTQACQSLIKQILDGHLPIGLIPTGSDLAWLTPASQNNPDYQRAIVAPLFIKDDQQKYDLNYEQAHQLIDYLNKLVAQCRQKLDEPL